MNNRELLQAAYAHIGHALPDKLRQEIKAALAQPDEADVWLYDWFDGNELVKDLSTTNKEELDLMVKERMVHNIRPRYAHPQPEKKPLTAEQIIDLIPDMQEGWDMVAFSMWLARAVERAHGIKDDSCK